MIIGVIALFFSANTFAQTEKGSILVGANSKLGFNMQSQKDSDFKSSVFNLSPMAGYYIIDDLAVGAALEFDMESSKDKDGMGNDVKDKMTTFVFAPFVRYDLPFGTETIKPFVMGEFGFGSSNYDGDSYPSKVTLSTTVYSLEAGATFFLNKNVGIDLGLGYGSVKMKNKDTDTDITSSNFGLNGGLVIFISR